MAISGDILQSPILKGLGHLGLGVGSTAFAALTHGNLSRAALGGVIGGVAGAIGSSDRYRDQEIASGAAAGAFAGLLGAGMLKGAMQTPFIVGSKLAKKFQPGAGLQKAGHFANNMGLYAMGAGAVGLGGIYAMNQSSYSSSLPSGILETPINQMQSQFDEQSRYGGGTLTPIPNPSVRDRNYEASTIGLVQSLNNRRHG